MQRMCGVGASVRRGRFFRVGLGGGLVAAWAFRRTDALNEAQPMLNECIGLFASTEPTTGLAAARPARTQLHYIEMLMAIPMPGYLSSYK